MLLLAGGVLLAELGGAGLAQAEPTAPPASAPLFQPGPGGNGKTTPGADAPRLASVDNFRDVAGTGAGYPAAHGKTVNRGSSTAPTRSCRTTRTSPPSPGSA